MPETAEPIWRRRELADSVQPAQRVPAIDLGDGVTARVGNDGRTLYLMLFDTRSDDPLGDRMVLFFDDDGGTAPLLDETLVATGSGVKPAPASPPFPLASLSLSPSPALAAPSPRQPAQSRRTLFPSPPPRSPKANEKSNSLSFNSICF